MIRFLKTYSNVPNGFTDDFFSIVSPEYNDEDIVIDFDIIVKWLEVRKDNLKAILVKKFSNNFDFTITKKTKKNNKNNRVHVVEKILVTPDCFKELCMISQTPKAKEVRLYYIELEKLIKKYYILIKNDMDKKINLLEKNQKPVINKKGGVIYFFKALNHIKIADLEEDDLHKIGKTLNLTKRFTQYNSGNANNLEPLFVLEVSDITKVEKCIKNLLNEYQYRKKKRYIKFVLVH